MPEPKKSDWQEKRGKNRLKDDDPEVQRRKWFRECLAAEESAREARKKETAPPEPEQPANPWDNFFGTKKPKKPEVTQ